LESVFNYGNLDENTDILIYTSTDFMNIIKQSHLFNEKIQFELNNNYNDIDKACKARLDLFHLKSSANYSKFLYLDTDILIKDDINKVFDLSKEDILYVLEEGSIDNDANFWGKSLFGDDLNKYEDKTAFSSGIMLFNNCEKIKDLFNKITESMLTMWHSFHDQPFVVYNAFKYNLYNNKIMKDFAVNNDSNVHSTKVIHHFPGGFHILEHKLNYMNKFLNELKELNVN
jgi:lipopolysaccharide biosynthesis glycosyltransferase